MARFGSVVFDCDSTLSAIEGIDELAGEHHAEIQALTDAAMRGEVPLQDVYGRRLAIVRPGRERVAQLGRSYIEALVPGTREVLGALSAARVQVRVVSGGLRPAVLALTRTLAIPDEDVAAVEIRFDAAGAYAGYDADSPLTRSDGKATVLRGWLPALAGPVLMVGDGITDLEARPPADMFAAFTGVVARERVVAAADFVAASMMDVRRLVLG